MPEAGDISKSIRPRKSGAFWRATSPVSKPERLPVAFSVLTTVRPATNFRREASRRATAFARSAVALALPGSSRRTSSNWPMAASYWRAPRDASAWPRSVATCAARIDSAEGADEAAAVGAGLGPPLRGEGDGDGAPEGVALGRGVGVAATGGAVASIVGSGTGATDGSLTGGATAWETGGRGVACAMGAGVGAGPPAGFDRR